MPVYVVIDIKILNAEMYQEYIDQVAPIVQKYGGRYLARGGNIMPLGGGWQPERMILLEFASEEQVRDWLQSPEYAGIAPLRENATESRGGDHRRLRGTFLIGKPVVVNNSVRKSLSMRFFFSCHSEGAQRLKNPCFRRNLKRGRIASSRLHRGQVPITSRTGPDYIEDRSRLHRGQVPITSRTGPD